MEPKLEIIAHRGYWLLEEEKNTVISFERALTAGFGIETDLRDYCGTVVISHDIPDGSSISFENLLQIYSKTVSKSSETPTLALNIKSDGLASVISQLLQKYNVNSYFVFDMSVPDSLHYIKSGLKAFTRQSEFEVNPCLYEESDGVWLDCFSRTWFSEALVTSHLEAGKGLCIVSPELHKRGDVINEQWMMLRSYRHVGRLSLCTDFPSDAWEFFNA